MNPENFSELEISRIPRLRILKRKNRLRLESKSAQENDLKKSQPKKIFGDRAG
jgi:hypothetical protein